jgi:hypothetical protein
MQIYETMHQGQINDIIYERLEKKIFGNKEKKYIIYSKIHALFCFK